jgi:hypothetical protein
VANRSHSSKAHLIRWQCPVPYLAFYSTVDRRAILTHRSLTRVSSSHFQSFHILVCPVYPWQFFPFPLTCARGTEPHAVLTAKSILLMLTVGICNTSLCSARKGGYRAWWFSFITYSHSICTRQSQLFDFVTFYLNK